LALVRFPQARHGHWLILQEKAPKSRLQ